MKRFFIISMLLASVLSSVSAAAKDYPLGSEIGITDEKGFDAKTGAQTTFQAFALVPEVYHYFYVGFMQDRPSSNPNIIPASISSYTLVDIRSVAENLAPDDNMTFITDIYHPIWLWYRIKSTYAVRIDLSFTKIYFGGDSTSPAFFYPYVSLYEPDGKTELKVDGVFYSGRGGWRPSGKSDIDTNPDNNPGRNDPKYTPVAGKDYDLYHVTGDSVVLTVMDEKEVKNISRGGYAQMKMECHYGGDVNNIEIGQYRAPMVLTVTVK